MIIHMEKTFKAMKCQKWIKISKRNENNGKPTKKALDFLGFLFGNFNISDIFYKI